MSYIEALDLQIDHTLQHEQFIYNSNNKKGDLKEKLVGADIASIRLVNSSDLKYMKIFPNVNLYYIYDKRKGYYRKFTTKDVRICIVRIFKELDLVSLGGKDVRYLDLVCRNLETQEEIFQQGAPSFTKGYLVFTNGVLDLKERRLNPWSPQYFLPSSLPFPYQPEIQPYRFFEFLENVSEGFSKQSKKKGGTFEQKRIKHIWKNNQKLSKQTS